MSVNPVVTVQAITTASTITCPECAASKTETMPIDACQFFYDCASCGALLRPKPGDCCVFCSYGSMRCPSKQGGVSGGAHSCEA